QVTTMVTRLLRLPDRPRPADAADALAPAICPLLGGRAPAPPAAPPGAGGPGGGGPMIASVRGPVAAVGPAGAVVEVGGVGLAVSCSPGTLARLRVGQPARLGTSPGRPGGARAPVG